MLNKNIEIRHKKVKMKINNQILEGQISEGKGNFFDWRYFEIDL